jgi:hypothetical protein
MSCDTSDRIEFEFSFEGVRYRPTLKRVPTEANLRRAYKQLVDIKLRIKTGTFKFEDEFPDYRFKGALPTANDSKPEVEAREKKKPETCNQVFDRFIAHCELRVSKDDMALSTLKGLSRDPGSRLSAGDWRRLIRSSLLFTACRGCRGQHAGL